MSKRAINWFDVNITRIGIEYEGSNLYSRQSTHKGKIIMTKTQGIKEIKKCIENRNQYLNDLINRNDQSFYTKEIDESFRKNINEITNKAKLSYFDLIDSGIIYKDWGMKIKI